MRHEDEDRELTPIAERPFLYVDCETTGFGSKHTPCEIGAVLIRNGIILEKYETLVNPGRDIPPEATAIHGISDADVIGAPPLEDALIPLKALARRADAIASHNVLFDRPMMKFGEDKPWICTLAWSRNHFHPGPHQLAALAERIGVESVGGHDALTDAIMGARILDHLLRNSELALTFRSPQELGEYLIDDQRRFQAQKKLEREARAAEAALEATPAQITNSGRGTAA